MDISGDFGTPGYPFSDRAGARVRRIGLMAVVNLTTDSFYDGGNYRDQDAAIERCRRCLEEGADIIDLGAESTRPGSQGVESSIQLDRLLPVIRWLRKFSDVAISVDTSEPEVMDACLGEGADMINDVCALERPGALDVVSRYQCAVCLMHKQGTPRHMQDKPVYLDVVEQVRRYLFGRVVACLEAGLEIERLSIDPGFGFGKDFAHNYTLLSSLPSLCFAGLPIIVGLSRKTMIGAVLNQEERADPRLRLEGSLIANAYAAWQGANIIRTHDVAQTRRALTTALLIERFHRT